MGTIIPIGHYGLDIEGKLPKRINDVLLIVGGGPDGMDQAESFAKDTKCDVAAVNGAIAKYKGPLFLAISMQEVKVAQWVAARKNQKTRPCVIANDPLPEGVEGSLDAVVRLDRACASSGIYAALIGRAMGYQRIVLAGVTMERAGERKAYEGLIQAAVKKGALTGVESLSGGWLAQALKAKN